MPIDPQFDPFLDLMRAMPPLSEVPLAVAREGLVPRGNPPPVASVTNYYVPIPNGSIPARLYRSHPSSTQPLVVYFHGGGFVLGDLDGYEDFCRRLCLGADCAVLSVAYRLAPEFKFPAAPDDCLASVRWAAANAGMLGIDSARIAIAGDSAGGNLAAVTAMRLRDEGGPMVIGQLLLYPVADHYSRETESYRQNGAGPFLTRADMAFFFGHYLSTEAEANHPHVAPLRAENLAALPPALVITAEFDPLRDEGETYAARLSMAGNKAEVLRYAGAIHGFMMLPDVSLGARATREAGLWLRDRFAAAAGFGG